MPDTLGYTAQDMANNYRYGWRGGIMAGILICLLLCLFAFPVILAWKC